MSAAVFNSNSLSKPLKDGPKNFASPFVPDTLTRAEIVEAPYFCAPMGDDLLMIGLRSVGLF
jgi:hypothetical protein